MKQRLALLGIMAFIIACLPLAFIRLLYAILTNPNRAWDIELAFDRVGNAALNGNPKESISSRANRGSQEGNTTFCILCKLLNILDPDHCSKSAGS